MGLDEDGAAIGIKSKRDELRYRGERPFRQDLWIDIDGQCMEVNDAVEGIMGILERYPLPYRTEVVTKME